MKPIILPYNDIHPKIDESAYIAPGAVVAGDIEIGSESSVWFNVSMRGDVGPIRIGQRSNIQDNSVVHITKGTSTIIGDEVTVGHSVILHSATIENNAVIGMGSTMLDGSYVEERAMLAAGSLLTPGKRVPTKQLWAGRPAKYVRDLTEQDLQDFSRLYQEYIKVSKAYKNQS